SYAYPPGSAGRQGDGQRRGRTFTAEGILGTDALPPKSLLGIPWRTAFALQDDGWILRNDIVWHKPNAMPESVRDRLSSRHEHLFLFTKSTWRGPTTALIADVDASWLAALVDGEGTITIGRDQRSEKEPRKQDVYQVTLSIANTSVPLLEKARQVMGCNAQVRQSSPGVNRPVYALQVSGEQAAFVIRAIKPWLIDKLTQADIAIALQDTQRRAGMPKSSYATADGAAYKERLWEVIKAANRREQVDLSWLRRPAPGQYVCNKYWFDLDAIREPVARAWTAGKNGTTGTHGRSGVDERATRMNNGMATTAPNPLGSNPGDVWSIATRPYPAAHFAVFPIDLPLRCIKAGCRPGGTVLDPFSGSGTTGAAARQLGRRYVGIDLNPAFHDLAKARFAQGVLDLGSTG
ncbi:DNA methyltransferase, partial [Streptomyces capuensis]|uniref:DNA methyltransferase n=1 Tax=Streptomyces capuensis TaxID=1464056 RepID=UPI00067D7D21